MRDYIRTDIEIQPWSEDMADFLSALLGDIGYESFTHNAPLLTAYTYKDSWDCEAANALIADFPAPGVTLKATHTVEQGRDWNHEWEKNYFQPLVIGDKVVVRSSFHTNAPKADYEIVVDPKMAFGTGHHSTTRLMMEYLLNNSLQGLTVTDMGTGTGILAILACMLGAKEVYGIEIDSDAYANACDNAVLNSVHPRLICGDASQLSMLPKADLMLTNINRNIITADIDRYRQALKEGGKLICSGFYLPDLDVIRAYAEKNRLQFNNYALDNEWVRAEFTAT